MDVQLQCEFIDYGTENFTSVLFLDLEISCRGNEKQRLQYGEGALIFVSFHSKVRDFDGLEK